MPLSDFLFFLPARRRIAGFCILFLALLALSACSEKQDQNTKPTQIAAVVNGVEITQHEVDVVYRRTELSELPAEAAAARRRAILADLVRSEALAQEAITRKLDAAPELLVEAHLARRKALAQQVERQTLRATPGAAPQAVKDFVNNTPHRFAERQLLTLEEMALVTPDESLFEKLDVAAGQGAGLDRLEQMVRDAKGKAQRKLLNVGTEQLPLTVLKPLLAAKPGMPIVVKNMPDRGSVLLLRSAAPTPQVGEAAEKAAAAMINTQLRQQAMQQTLKKVLETTTITYHGEFAPDALAPGQGGAAAKSPQAIELPKGAYEPQKRNRYQRLSIAAVAAGAIALAVLMLVASLSYWRSTVWLPRLWPKRQPQTQDISKMAPDQDQETDPNRRRRRSGKYIRVDDAEMTEQEKRRKRLGKFLLALMIAVLTGVLGWQLFGASYWLAPWTLATILAGGLLVGIAASQLLLGRSSLRKSIENSPGQLAAVFAMLQLGVSAAGILLV